MIPIQAPDEPWLHERYACQSCGGTVQFEIKDRGDSAFLMRNGRPSRARCVFCGHALARFVLVEETEMPIPLKDDDLTLTPCVLCGRGYPPSAMWPRPDGFICKFCQGEVRDAE